ncbi:MAG: hypothetical protein UX09_C0003G0004 [Candidatus Uhrbacteria bacterium GW2011_GWE2_45_35]|uniref:SbsA Ig-like domain-containing protein n=2 Tax=Candidatus Uhriibacteriota TaxID=1752732 RepID=A0A0G1JDV8_9BACT|nr:MAG: hypothetical protein UW63_C0056G0002 [Candidatus Uhrbacteria bacterium GW2011_GWF2_44_350]KKU09130.1 MAG: hypothetical protein UX09_C0003G0004 [Candidatus Uhrbacteria bacterium GW2011_GWE2_45_35]HBR80552.1 hypothetical protein [Candidatus Uhrbacteria bacterium]HCU31462.1 hypothetical protein [Candidatus Uhrbacteria bacterium]
MKINWKNAAIGAATVGIILTAIFVFTPTHFAFAQLDTLEGTALEAQTGLATESLPIVIARVIRIFIGVLGLILVCLFVYAGFLYLTARGEPTPVEKARKIIKNAIIGMAIVLLSFSITTFILNRLLAAAGFAGGVTTSGAGNYTEPLSGSLGSGVIESHYPARYATEIPRNTRISVTFKEAISLDSIISDYATGAAAGASVFDLNSAKVLIFETAAVTDEVSEAEVALGAAEVDVSFVPMDLDDDGVVDPWATIFVFDPVDLLGNATTDTNYTIKLEPTILKADGSLAFSGAYSSGYEWTFEVSTEVDLTPPYVVSVVPVEGSDEAPNVVVQITFNEAMDPVAASGEFIGGTGFTHIEVLDLDSTSAGSNVEGTFSVVNNYRTVEFLPNDVCASDPCGNDIYCLPFGADLEVQAHAASLGADPPQAEMVGGLFTGLVDACGNSLDGNGDRVAQGSIEDTVSGLDDYEWNFTTTSEINDRSPAIVSLLPTLTENSNIDVNQNIEFVFDILLQASTVNSSNVKLLPNHAQELWFSDSSVNADPDSTVLGDEYSTAIIRHAQLWETVIDAAGVTTLYYYYPLVNQGVKSAWQICMFPSYGPHAALELRTSCADSAAPFCCNGFGQSTPCVRRMDGSLLQ